MALDPGGFSSEFGPGTAPPSPPTDLTNAPSPLVLTQYGNVSSITLRSAGGTQANPTPVPGNWGLAQVDAQGWDGSAFGGYAAIYFRSTQAYTPTAHGSEILFYTAPNNSPGAQTAAGVSQGGALWCGGPGVLPTNATDAFFGTPTMAGAPTGVPVINYGTAPMVFDTVNNLLRIYDAGWFALATQGQAASFTGLTAATLSVTGSANLTNATLVTPLLGTPTSGVLTNCTGLPLTTGVVGILPVANGGTGVTTSTGTGANVLATSPTLNTSLTLTSAAASTLTIDAPAANLRSLQYTSGGLGRWFLNCSSTAESGANVGSDFVIQRRDDTGANLGSVLTITRSTGVLAVLSGLAISGSTAHGVLVGQGASPVTSAAPGTAGQVLTSQGAGLDPVFATLPTSTAAFSLVLRTTSAALTGDNTVANVPFDTIEFDQAGSFGGVAGSVFTCAAAGIYEFALRVTAQATFVSTNTSFDVRLVTAGSTTLTNINRLNPFAMTGGLAASQLTSEITALLKLAVGDTVTASFNVGGSAKNTTAFGGANDFTVFSGRRVA